VARSNRCEPMPLSVTSPGLMAPMAQAAPCPGPARWVPGLGRAVGSRGWVLERAFPLQAAEHGITVQQARHSTPSDTGTIATPAMLAQDAA
jgi:hypothetical protein